MPLFHCRNDLKSFTANQDMHLSWTILQLHDGGMYSLIVLTDECLLFAGYPPGVQFSYNTNFTGTVKEPEYGFIIHLQENAFPSGVDKVYVRVSSYEDFDLPQVTECVSKIYWIHNDFTKPIHNEHSDKKFAKPVTVEIEHWTAKLDIPQYKFTLRFVDAKCPQNDIPYKFKLCEDKPNIPSKTGRRELTSFGGVGIVLLRKYIARLYKSNSNQHNWTVELIMYKNAAEVSMHNPLYW